MTLPVVFQIVATPAGKPKGSTNCNPCCGAICVIHATGGAVRPTGSEVRDLCLEPNGKPDVIGGTALRQVADAIERGWDVEMEVITPQDYTKFRSRMKADRKLIASVSVSYSGFKGTSAYASRTGFMANHQVVVRWVGIVGKEWEMSEPLADGRGVPLAPVSVSDAVLRRAAGALVITSKVNGHNVSWPLGAGSVYVGYVRGKSAPVPVRYSVRFTPGSFFVYSVQGDVAIVRVSKEFAKRTSAPCLAPQPIPYPTAGSARKKLARVTSGSLKGQYVEPGRSHVELVTA